MKTGDKIWFKEASDEQVRWGGNDDPRTLLRNDIKYTVKDFEVHSWHSKVILEEFPDKKFNSVHFVVAP